MALRAAASPSAVLHLLAVLVWVFAFTAGAGVFIKAG